jgi:DNA-binding PadR family transcriptional regulator
MVSVYMQVLELTYYFICDKDFWSPKPQTIYRITPKGHEAFIRYKESFLHFLEA